MSIDFTEVVAAARAGDKAAKDALMTHFYAWSITQARRVIRDSETAKNVALDFWVWLYNGGGLNKYDSAKGSFFTWMRVCIQRRAQDELRRTQPKSVGALEVSPSDSADLSNPALSLEIKQQLAEKLRSPTHKEVFWLLANGATPAEIAEELQLSEKRVRNVIGELRELVRATIDEAGAA